MKCTTLGQGLLLGAALLLHGCAAKVLILQSPVVSMKKLHTPKGESLKEGKEINVQWCTNEAPIVENDDGSKSYGMIDQTILKAHKETKADFFVNNRFYAKGSCIIMQANAANEGSGGGSVSEPDEPKAKTKGSGPVKHKKKKKS